MDETSTAAVSQFNQALAQAGEGQRVLFHQAGQLTRDESLRFANLRLERNGALIDKLSTSVGLGGLFAAQQEWLRDFINDYTAHSQHVAGMFRGMAHTAVVSAAQSAGETVDRVHTQASEAMRQTAEAIDETGDNIDAAAREIAQQADHAEQETRH